jgi:hypothetical protein
MNTGRTSQRPLQESKDIQSYLTVPAISVKTELAEQKYKLSLPF